MCGLSTVRLLDVKVECCVILENTWLLIHSFYVIGGPAGCGWVLREMDEYGAISRVSNCCAFEIMLIISLNSMLGVIVSIVCRQR